MISVHQKLSMRIRNGIVMRSAKGQPNSNWRLSPTIATMIVLSAMLMPAIGWYLQVRNDNQLVGAIKRGDVLAVETALSLGANPNSIIVEEHPVRIEEVLCRLFNWKSRPGSNSKDLPVMLYCVQKSGFNGTMPPNGRPIDNVCIVSALLEFGADPSACDEDGESVLALAAAHELPYTCRLLLQKHAAINSRDKWGRSPLFFSHGPNQIGLVALLLNYGADANATDNKGRTVLMEMCDGSRDYGSCSRICDRDDLENVRLLLEHGAAVNARSSDGTTAMRIAKQYGSPEIVNLLKKYGATE